MTTSPVSTMITQEEQKAVLARAYVPEHSPELMASISRGEPFLFEDYFCCQTQYGIVIVGYPLEHDFQIDRFEDVLNRIIKAFRSVRISLIAPQAPIALKATFVERNTDKYYALDLPASVRAGPMRRVRKAREAGTVEYAAKMTDAHHDLAREFADRVGLPPRIRELLFRTRDYVGTARGASVINVWDRRDKLAAFFVVDFAPKDFSTYVIGCHSKSNYVPGASDLLMSELIKISNGLGKRFIHLGIGVNAGIRLFKEKWGGIPTMPYELCEMIVRKSSPWDAFIGSIGRS